MRHKRHEGGDYQYLTSEDWQKVDELSVFVEDSIFDPELRTKIDDPVELSFLKGIYSELAHGGLIRPHLAEVFALRRAMGSHFPIPYALRLLELAWDKQMKKYDRAAYPTEYDSIFKSKESFSRLNFEEMFVDMVSRGQGYNNQSAYGYFDIQLRAFYEKTGRQPVVVDVGGGLGQGSRKLMLQQKYPFASLTPLTGFPHEEGEVIVDDLEMKRRFEELRAKESKIGGVVSADITASLNDKDTVDWYYSNTFPMSREIRDQVAVAEFWSLLAEPGMTSRLQYPSENHRFSENLHSNFLVYNKPIDFLNPESVRQLNDILPEGKADFYIFSGVILQWSEEETARAFRNIIPHCNDEAQISVNDWAKVDFKSPSGLRIIQGKYWQAFGGFSNFWINPFKLHEGPICTGHFPNRRAEEIVLTAEGRDMFLANAA